MTAATRPRLAADAARSGPTRLARCAGESARRAPGSCLRAWRRIPRAGRACALIAFVNVAIWSVIVPPFMVPDEITNFGYAQYLAETGSAPPQTPGAVQFSP